MGVLSIMKMNAVFAKLLQKPLPSLLLMLEGQTALSVASVLSAHYPGLALLSLQSRLGFTSRKIMGMH